MSWFSYALLSAVCAGLVAVFGKIGVKEIDSNLATAVRSVIMTGLMFVVVTIQGSISKIGAIPKFPLLFILLSGLAGALSWVFYFKALRIGNVSQVAAIDKLSVAFAVILSVMFLKESINPKLALGVLLMIAGTVVISQA